jgi:hypothetical protein
MASRRGIEVKSAPIGTDPMSTHDQLLGVWNGSSMLDPSAESYDILVFNADGTGFLDLYDAEYRFSELFRWEFRGDDLHLAGTRISHPHVGPRGLADFPSALNAITPVIIRDGVLRLLARPWPGMSEHHRYYRRDIPMYATFQARAFLHAEEADDRVFRGTALSDFLAPQLRSRGFSVSARQKVYFGACYYRTVTIRGTDLGFGVNAYEDGPGWWLRIDRPQFGGEAEAEELYRVLNAILDAVEGLRGLRWQTEEEWRAEAVPA